jgi:hypothetical protein
MYAHLQHTAAYGQTVSEIPRLRRAKPGEDSSLSRRIAQAA